jgi:hypothetical protein
MDMDNAFFILPYADELKIRGCGKKLADAGVIVLCHAVIF